MSQGPAEIRHLLHEGLSAMGIQASETQLAMLDTYARLLLEKNQVMNLTAITDPVEVVRFHFLDSLALLHCLPPAPLSLIDVGTGAGFPGVALKIMRPELRLTLLDGLQKRLLWLEEVCACLCIPDVTFLHARAEEAAKFPPHRDGYDIATARAVARLNVLTELCLPFVKVGGRLLAMKADGYEAEAAEGARAAAALGGRYLAPFDYAIPGAAVTRRVAVLEKQSPTPPHYPRRWAKIQKNPL